MLPWPTLLSRVIGEAGVVDGSARTPKSEVMSTTRRRDLKGLVWGGDVRGCRAERGGVKSSVEVEVGFINKDKGGFCG